MKKIMATIGMLALLVGTGFAQDKSLERESNPDRKFEHHRKHGGILADIPDLTEEQKAKIKEIKEVGRKSMEPMRTEMKALKGRIMELKTAENPNQAEINKLIDQSSKIRSEMEKSRTASELKIRSILTPEQRKVLDAKMKERHAKREQKHLEMKQRHEAK